jgi:tetratricopeptide (TPR) repeat protein
LLFKEIAIIYFQEEKIERAFHFLDKTIQCIANDSFDKENNLEVFEEISDILIDFEFFDLLIKLLNILSQTDYSNPKDKAIIFTGIFQYLLDTQGVDKGVEILFRTEDSREKDLILEALASALSKDEEKIDTAYKLIENIVAPEIKARALERVSEKMPSEDVQDSPLS